MITIRTAAERPDLWKISNDAPAVWPEYNMHGDVVNQWWGLLDEELPQFQFALYDDEAGSVAARGLTGPLAWNGQDEALPDGIDQAIEQIFTQHRSHPSLPLRTTSGGAGQTGNCSTHGCGPTSGWPHRPGRRPRHLLGTKRLAHPPHHRNVILRPARAGSVRSAAGSRARP